MILKLASLCPEMGLRIFKYQNVIYHAKTSKNKYLFKPRNSCKHRNCKKPGAATFIMDFNRTSPQACVQYISRKTTFVCILELPKSFVPCLNASLNNSTATGSSVKLSNSKPAISVVMDNELGLILMAMVFINFILFCQYFHRGCFRCFK